MSKIKHTKTELKAQSDALKRYQRFLPMLQLKKQQLQAEIAAITVHIESIQESEKEARQKLDSWVALYSDPQIDTDSLVKFHSVKTAPGNIAGVAIPLYHGVDAEDIEQDPYRTPAWVDDAQVMLRKLIEIKAEIDVLIRQRELVDNELHTTSQRVNLFEKVKIPECKENIRIIRIFIGDEQTAAVARGKIAKGRSAKIPEELTE